MTIGVAGPADGPDAGGHDGQAAIAAALAGILALAVRAGELASMAREVGSAINAVGDEVEFVSAVLVELDPATGEGSWLSAGHLPPLVVDDGIAALELSPALPLGPEVNGRTSEPIVKIPDRPDGHGTWRGPSSRTCCS